MLTRARVASRLRGARLCARRGPAALLLLLAALDLPGEVVGALVDGAERGAAGLTRPERHALEVERCLGDLFGRPLLLRQLDIEPGQWRDLLGDLLEPPFHPGP